MTPQEITLFYQRIIAIEEKMTVYGTILANQHQDFLALKEKLNSWQTIFSNHNDRLIKLERAPLDTTILQAQIDGISAKLIDLEQKQQNLKPIINPFKFW